MITKAIQRISTVGMDREEWLKLRRGSIGGSDAAAIVGLSKWSTPYTVWADKTGRLPDKQDTEAMRIGRDLEEYVAKRWVEETGKGIRRCNAILKNEAYPFAHANVDRLVVGEDAGLECKTTSTLDVKQFGRTDFPEQYYAQCVHYLAVTGLKKWYLAVLCFGKGFFIFELERDEAEIEALMSAERTFWAKVEMDTPPTPDGMEPTAEAVKTIYAESRDGETRDLFGREGLLTEYMELKRQEKALDERMTEIENVIKLDMEDAEKGAAGRYSVTWKAQERKTFQAKDFAADHPEIDLAKYYKKTTTRPFKVAEVKET